MRRQNLPEVAMSDRREKRRRWDVVRLVPEHSGSAFPCEKRREERGGEV